jgi:hypothetical protein
MEYSVFSRRRFVGSLTTLPYAARLAWDIVLYEADKLRGRVFLPPFDLANAAVITIDEARDALAKFQEPDPNSATEAEDGRRLLPIEGEPHWYKVVTWEEHEKERKAYFNRLRQQRWYAKHAEKQEPNDLTQPNATKRDLTKEPEPEPEVKTASKLSSHKKEEKGSKAFLRAPAREKQKKATPGHTNNGNGEITEKQYAAIAWQVRKWNEETRDLRIGGSNEAYERDFNRQQFGVTFKRFEKLRSKFEDSS